ncbi:MAG: hypothetical protein KDD70_09915 [Bdellovibrionales bacterium]|nr:hypothetical protein [Bdellovibrionales bacterium]
MSDSVTYFLFISIGAVIQGSRYLRTREDFYKAAGILVASLLGFIPGKKEVHYDLSMHIGVVGFMFALLFGSIFRDKILRTLSERVILEFTLVFHYALWTQVGYESEFGRIALYIVSLPTLLVLGLALFPGKPPKFVKLVMYTWFISMNVYLLVMQLMVDEVTAFFQEPISAWTLGYAVIFGMICFHLVVNVFYLLNLLPIPGKRESMRECLKRVGEHVNVLVSKVDDSQIHPFATLAIVFAFAAVLYLNTLYSWIPEWVVIQALLVIFLFLSWISAPSEVSISDE